MNIPEFLSKNMCWMKVPEYMSMIISCKNMRFHVQEHQAATKATKATKTTKEAAIPAAIPAIRAARKMNKAQIIKKVSVFIGRIK
jgi:hypothetical protein